MTSSLKMLQKVLDFIKKYVLATNMIFHLNKNTILLPVKTMNNYNNNYNNNNNNNKDKLKIF